MPATWLGRDSQGILRDFTGEDVDESVMPAEVQGGEQTIRKIGPFHVAHDTPDIWDGILSVAALASGTIVLRAWAVFTEEWSGGDVTGFTIGAGGSDAATEGDWGTCTTYTNLAPTGGQGFQTERIPDQVPRIVVLSEAGHLIAAPSSGGPPATQGEADVYALIAEPAA